MGLQSTVVILCKHRETNEYVYFTNKSNKFILHVTMILYHLKVNALLLPNYILLTLATSRTSSGEGRHIPRGNCKNKLLGLSVFGTCAQILVLLIYVCNY